MDSIANPKVKTMEGKGVGACFLAHNISGVEGLVRAPGWDQERQVIQLLTKTCKIQTTNQLMHSYNTLVHRQATSDHGFKRLTIAQTWGKPPPSPLQCTLCLATRLAPKCHFVLGLPNGNPEIPKVETSTILKAHNFM